MRRGTRTTQAGFTLVELTVTVLILTLVLASASAAFLSANKASTAVDNRIENLGQAQLLIRAATKDLRTATPLDNGNVPAFMLATPWRVEFYAYLNTNTTTPTASAIPKKVRLRVDTTTDPKNPTLVEEVWEPASGWTSSAPTYMTTGKLRFVGQYITNTPSSGTPVFDFYDNSSPPAKITPGATGTYGPELTADQLKSVHAVLIRLTVRKAKLNDVKGTTVENRVRLPNVIYNPVSSST